MCGEWLSGCGCIRSGTHSCLQRPPHNHPANGLLLRSDLHTLFDLDRLEGSPVVTPGVPATSQPSLSSTSPVTTGEAAKAAGNVQPTSADRNRAPLAVEAFAALRFVRVQIWVPSAKRTNSPFAPVPRSITATRRHARALRDCAEQGRLVVDQRPGGPDAARRPALPAPCRAVG